MSREQKDLSRIQVMVIAETQQQRLAFSDTVVNIGFSLVGCIAPDDIEDKHRKAKIDIWLVDSQFDDNLFDKLHALPSIHDNTILVGFSKAPFLNETQLYTKWQRKLKRKLAVMLDLPQICATSLYEAKHEPWKYVVFLGASMGGPSAIKAFLDAVSPKLPITILLAHHFNSKMIHTLPRVLNRHNDWRCQVVSTSQKLQSGQCLIAPVEQKIICTSKGRVILSQEKWEGEYKPCIGELLKNTSDVYGNELISIIFSGMGNDGTQYLEEIQENHSQLWAQEPNDSACPSQPQAVIDTGYCHFVGTAEQLAERLTQYVTEKIV